MDVTVVPHVSSRQDFLDWEARILARPGGSRTMFNLHVRTMKEELIRKAGVPDGVEKVPDTNPQVYQWHFLSDIYIRYVIRDEPGSILHTRERRIIIMEIRPLPPVDAH